MSTELAVIVLVLILLGANAFIWVFSWNSKRGNPALLFVGVQTVFALSSIYLSDLQSPMFLAYCVSLVMSVVFAALGSLYGMARYGIPGKHSRFFAKPIVDERDTTKLVGGVLLVLALGVTVLYYRAIGYNLAFTFLTGSRIDDVVTARLATYSGRTYYAPGYVNQFKNVIFPVLGIFFILRLHLMNRTTAKYLAIVAFIPLAFYALAGTGQRVFIVFTFATLLYSIILIQNYEKWILVALGVTMVMLFGFVSAYIGRIGDASASASVIQLAERMFLTEPRESLIGHRLVMEEGTVWFKQWGQDIAGILPGVKGSDLQNRVFYEMHGNMRGTGAVSTVSTVILNGTYLFIPIVYFVFGTAMSGLFSRFLTGPRSVLRIVIYASLFFYLATFVSGTPMALINRGVVTLLILLVARKVDFK